MSNKTTQTAMLRICLQVDTDACTDAEGNMDGADEPFPHEADVSWCSEQIGGLEVEYVRADLVRAAMPVNWMDDLETLALGEALRMPREPVIPQPAPLRNDRNPLKANG